MKRLIDGTCHVRRLKKEIAMSLGSLKRSRSRHISYPEFAATAARMLDDDLCAAIGVADAEHCTFRLDGHQQAAFMAAALVRRLEGRRAA